MWLSIRLVESQGKGVFPTAVFRENLAEITFVSYLTIARQDFFYKSKEQFWGKLARRLDKTKTRVNWLFLYERNNHFNSVKSFRKYVASMNNDEECNGNHIDLFSFFGWVCFCFVFVFLFLFYFIILY